MGSFIYLRLLGTAAGGGYPQWNCGCPNCQLARSGQIPPQTQSGMAVSADGQAWFLINASPDVGQQIQSFPALHPQALRQSPIHGVLLTNGDLDHVLGLHLLREGDPLQIHTTPAIRQTLEFGLHLDLVLQAYCGLNWQTPSFANFLPLGLRNGRPSGLSYRAIPLPGSPPPFARTRHFEGVHGLAYLLRDDLSGRTALIAPDVSLITAELQEAWHQVDALFWDGTFWSDHELQHIKPTARTAREIGHVPIFPEVLEKTAGLTGLPRIFLHINNTNPLLNPSSPERRTVQESGWIVGSDGWEIQL